MKRPRLDRELLFAVEREELADIHAASAKASHQRWRTWSRVAVGVIYVFWALLIHAGAHGANGYSPWHALTLSLLPTAIFGFIAVLGVAHFADWVSDREELRQVDTLLEQVGYAERMREKEENLQALRLDRERRASRQSSDGSYPRSARQTQHEWYGEHTELNFRHREQAEALGMDADTYVSNFLESD